MASRRYPVFVQQCTSASMRAGKSEERRPPHRHLCNALREDLLKTLSIRGLKNSNMMCVFFFYRVRTYITCQG